jgi:hypothetical protein
MDAAGKVRLTGLGARTKRFSPLRGLILLTYEFEEGSFAFHIGKENPMPKQLVINGPESTWKLPPSASIESIDTDLASAIREGLMVDIDVELDPGVVGTLHVNGRNVVAAAVMELPDTSPARFGVAPAERRT